MRTLKLDELSGADNTVDIVQIFIKKVLLLYQEFEMMYDAIIIGGGVIGVAVARELTLLGKKCVIFEKNGMVLGEASSGNTGHLASNFYYTKDRAPLEYALPRIAARELNPEWFRTQPNVPRKKVRNLLSAHN